MQKYWNHDSYCHICLIFAVLLFYHIIQPYVTYKKNTVVW